MDINDLPSFVRKSVILLAEEKSYLASIERLPTEVEVDEIRNLAEVLELTNAFIGDESSRDTHLQIKAQEVLKNRDLSFAWKILLL